jgi:predicted TIM-barrel fold metal-dependent hydrolase
MDDVRPFDADNHYYEPLDAFTRHLDPEFARRGVQIIGLGKRTALAVGGKISYYIPNPTFDPVAVPGCLDPYFRGEIPEGMTRADLVKVTPLAESPEYMNRDARIKRLDEQGLAGAVLYPTVGVGVEEMLTHDIPALMASAVAFNRWMEEDWGYAYENRLFAAPYLSLADPEAALVELDRVLAAGARIVVMRPAPVPGVGGSRSLGHPTHDPVWARLAEARVPVTFHAADSGYNSYAEAWGVPSVVEAFKINVLSKIITADRAIYDTMASLVTDGVLARFPDLKVLSIENGAAWVRPLLNVFKKVLNQSPDAFDGDPIEQFKRQVWIAPYYEDDLRDLIELMGADKVLFGSDWPHAEGLFDPVSYVKEIDFLDEETQDKIMRTNMAGLIGL